MYDGRYKLGFLVLFLRAEGLLMESSVERHDTPDISKKSRSLDLHSFYAEKSRAYRGSGRAVDGDLAQTKETRGLKRTRCSSLDNKRAVRGQSSRTRKEVSLSSLEPIVKRRRKISNISGLNQNVLVTGGRKPQGIRCPIIVSHNSGFASDVSSNFGNFQSGNKKGKLGLTDGNVQDSSNLGDTIAIPKRPRGILRRKKVGNPANSCREGELSASTYRSNVGAEDNKLSSDLITSSEVLHSKRKKQFGDFKENGFHRNVSPPYFKSGDGSTIPVGVQRNRKMRKESTTGKPKKRDSESLLALESDKLCEDAPEDDEENLEQNAARMLSSRFDPRCTGFSGTTEFSSLEEKEGQPFLLQDGGFRGLRAEASSMGAAGRVLRPRKQNGKGLFRKRRHFYEVSPRDMDPYWVLMRKIRVFWPLDQSWYFGLVKDYNPSTKMHHIKYDDREEEWVNLQNERFKLLLFPSEFSGKIISGESRADVTQKSEEVDEISMKNSHVGSIMESETIISWLARSTQRVKFCPRGILKDKKRSRVYKGFSRPLLTVQKEQSTSHVIPEGQIDRKNSELPVMRSKSDSGEGKFSIVYFRRRLHMTRERLSATFARTSASRSSISPGSFDITNRMEPVLKFEIPSTLMELKQGIFNLSLPLERVHDLAFLSENIWLCSQLMLLRYGTLILLWPKVLMEIVFIDNIVGLRFLSFEGCLKHAVTLLCLVIKTFHQSKDNNMLAELQIPLTSIGFSLLGLQDAGKQCFFALYNFFELDSLKWACLESKLKQYHVTKRELPVSECTNAILKSLLRGSDWTHSGIIREKPNLPEGFHKKSWHGIRHWLVSTRPATSDAGYAYFNSTGKHGNSATPSFSSLHHKLLVEGDVPSFCSSSFQKRGAMISEDCSENFDKLNADQSSHVDDDSSDQISEVTHENFGSLLNQTATGSGWLSQSHPKVKTDAFSISGVGDRTRSSHNSLNGKLYVNMNSLGHRDLGKNEDNESVFQLKSLPSYSGSPRGVEKPCSLFLEDISSSEKSEDGSVSFRNTSNCQTKPCSQGNHPLYVGGTKAAQQPVYHSAWNMRDYIISSPKPTAPRSVWHRVRRDPVSPTFGNLSKLWPEDFRQNGFVNSSKKPRTQVSYSSGGYDVGSKSRSHKKKGRIYNRVKSDICRKISTASGSPRNYQDSVTCDANILVTVGDRGWRECGAHIVLDSDNQRDWRILVKLSGAIRYSYKAHQFLQPGIVNRYSHAMMWRVGRDWTLEFTDRSQWNLFKEMHEECYNRNIKSATVKNIPIPGVRLIEDSDDCTVELPFVRAPKYYLQVGTEVDMALDPFRVLYDMDSDDERWSKSGNYLCHNETERLEISKEMFEKVMDKFEKVAYAKKCDEFTDAELDNYMSEVGQLDVIKPIYEYWRTKRKNKGMPLIRQFQPALWERYEQQLKEWELALNKTQNLANGCQERINLPEKPAMFAFCLRPRGLEVPNKGSKQRSHKKFSVSGHNTVITRDSDGFQVFGRKLNELSDGEERALVTLPNHVASDACFWLQPASKFSPRDATSSPFMMTDNSDSERNQLMKIHRNNSSKMRMLPSPRDSRMVSPSYNQRPKRNAAYGWNTGVPDWHSSRQMQSEGFQKHQADVDEFRLRDASSAAQHASNMAKLKREKAQFLFHKADVALLNAAAALVTAEAIKASEKDPVSDG